MKINEIANANQESGFKPFDGIDELIKFIKEKFNEYNVDKTIREKKIADVKRSESERSEINI